MIPSHIDGHDALSRYQKKRLARWLTEERHLYPQAGSPQSYLSLSIFQVLGWTTSMQKIINCRLIGSSVPQFVGNPISTSDVDICLQIDPYSPADPIELAGNTLCAGLAHCLISQNKLGHTSQYVYFNRALGNTINLSIFHIGHSPPQADPLALQIDLSLCLHNQSPGLFTPGRGEIDLTSWLTVLDPKSELNQSTHPISLITRGIAIETWKQSLQDRELLEPHPEQKYRALFRYPNYVISKGFRRHPALERALWKQVLNDFPEFISKCETQRIGAELTRRLPHDSTASMCSLVLWAFLIDDSPLDPQQRRQFSELLHAMWHEIWDPIMQLRQHPPFSTDQHAQTLLDVGLLRLAIILDEVDSQTSLYDQVFRPLAATCESRKWRSSIELTHEHATSELNSVYFPSPLSEDPIGVCLRLFKRISSFGHTSKTANWLWTIATNREEPMPSVCSLAENFFETVLQFWKQENPELNLAPFYRYFTLYRNSSHFNPQYCNSKTTPPILFLPGCDPIEMNRPSVKHLLDPLPSTIHQARTYQELHAALTQSGRTNWLIIQFKPTNVNVEPQPLRQAVLALQHWNDPFWTAVRCQLLCLLARLDSSNQTLSEYLCALIQTAQTELSPQTRKALLKGQLDLVDTHTDVVIQALIKWIKNASQQSALNAATDALLQTKNSQAVNRACHLQSETRSHKKTSSSLKKEPDHPLSVEHLLLMIQSIADANEAESYYVELITGLRELPSKLVTADFLHQLLTILTEKSLDWGLEALTILRRRGLLQRHGAVYKQLFTLPLTTTHQVRVIEWLEQDNISTNDTLWSKWLCQVAPAQAPKWVFDRLKHRVADHSLLPLALQTVNQLISNSPRDAHQLYKHFNFPRQLEHEETSLLLSLSSALAPHDPDSALFYLKQVPRPERNRLLDVAQWEQAAEQVMLVVSAAEAWRLYQQVDPDHLSANAHQRMVRLALAEELTEAYPTLLQAKSIDTADLSSLRVAYATLLVRQGDVDQAADYLHEHRETITNSERAAVHEAIIQAHLKNEITSTRAEDQFKVMFLDCPDERVATSRAWIAVHQKKMEEIGPDEVLLALEANAGWLNTDVCLEYEYFSLYTELAGSISTPYLLQEAANRLLIILSGAWGRRDRDDLPGIAYFAKHCKSAHPYLAVEVGTLGLIVPHFPNTHPHYAQIIEATQCMSTLISAIPREKLEDAERTVLYQQIHGILKHKLSDQYSPLGDQVIADAMSDPFFSDRASLLDLIQQNQQLCLKAAAKYRAAAGERSDASQKLELKKAYLALLQSCYEGCRTAISICKSQPQQSSLCAQLIANLTAQALPPLIPIQKDLDYCVAACTIGFQILALAETQWQSWSSCPRDRIQTYDYLITGLICSRVPAYQIIAAELILFCRTYAFPPGQRSKEVSMKLLVLNKFFCENMRLTQLTENYQICLEGNPPFKRQQVQIGEASRIWQLASLCEPANPLNWTTLLNFFPQSIPPLCSATKKRKGHSRRK